MNGISHLDGDPIPEPRSTFYEMVEFHVDFQNQFTNKWGRPLTQFRLNKHSPYVQKKEASQPQHNLHLAPRSIGPLGGTTFLPNQITINVEKLQKLRNNWLFCSKPSENIGVFKRPINQVAKSHEDSCYDGSGESRKKHMDWKHMSMQKCSTPTVTTYTHFKLINSHRLNANFLASWESREVEFPLWKANKIGNESMGGKQRIKPQNV